MPVFFLYPAPSVHLTRTPPANHRLAPALPHMQVAEHGSFALLDVLVECGASPASPALLTCVAEQGNTEALLCLLHRGAPLDAPGMLSALAATGQLGMLQRLAELGADLAGVPGLPEAAVSGGHVHVLDFLLGQGFEAQAVTGAACCGRSRLEVRRPVCAAARRLACRQHAATRVRHLWRPGLGWQAGSQPAHVQPGWQLGTSRSSPACPSPAGPPPPDQHARSGRGPDLSYPTKAVLAVLRKMEACTSDTPSSSSGPSSLAAQRAEAQHRLRRLARRLQQARLAVLQTVPRRPAFAGPWQRAFLFLNWVVPGMLRRGYQGAFGRPVPAQLDLTGGGQEQEADARWAGRAVWCGACCALGCWVLADLQRLMDTNACEAQIDLLFQILAAAAGWRLLYQCAHCSKYNDLRLLH